MSVMTLVTTQAGAKRELLFNKPASGLIHMQDRIEKKWKYKHSSLFRRNISDEEKVL